MDLKKRRQLVSRLRKASLWANEVCVAHGGAGAQLGWTHRGDAAASGAPSLLVLLVSQLARLAAQTCDARGCLETQAYAALIAGTAVAEREKEWTKALALLTRARCAHRAFGGGGMQVRSPASDERRALLPCCHAQALA